MRSNKRVHDADSHLDARDCRDHTVCKLAILLVPYRCDANSVLQCHVLDAIPAGCVRSVWCGAVVLDCALSASLLLLLLNGLSECVAVLGCVGCWLEVGAEEEVDAAHQAARIRPVRASTD